MKMGITTYAFAWNIGIPGWSTGPDRWTGLRLVQEAVSLGMTHIQFCENLSLLDMADGERDEVLAACKSEGISLDLGCRGLDEVRIRSHSQLSQELGAKWLRVVIDDADFRPTLHEAGPMLERLTPALQDAGVGIAIENHDRFRSPDLLALVQRLGPMFGVCLDTANSLGCLEGPLETAACLAPAAVMLHVKDVRAERLDHMLGFKVTGRPAGKGDVDLAAILDLVRQHGRVEAALLEQWPDPDGGIEVRKLEKEMAATSAVNLAELLARTN